MQDPQEENFQVATFIVVAVILLVCMCDLLIFVNPQVALNPLKPPLPTATAVAGLPPTWTPTPTETPTPTYTPTSTDTPTLTPTITLTPTESPIPTATRRIPTRTPRPTVSPYSYYPVFQSCQHSGGTFIEGTVYRTAAGEPQAGVRVALSSGPGTGDIYYVTSGTQGRSDGYYVHVLQGNGARPGDWYLWIADISGVPLSEPIAGHVTTNALPADNGGSCWRAVLDFVRR